MYAACNMYKDAVLCQKCVQGHGGTIAVAHVFNIYNGAVMTLQHFGHQSGGTAQAAHGDTGAKVG